MGGAGAIPAPSPHFLSYIYIPPCFDDTEMGKAKPSGLIFSFESFYVVFMIAAVGDRNGMHSLARNQSILDDYICWLTC
jgi:hypothetical protein